MRTRHRCLRYFLGIARFEPETRVAFACRAGMTDTRSSDLVNTAEVIFAYSNFRIPDLPALGTGRRVEEPGLLDQSALRAPLQLSRDDGPQPDGSWRITKDQQAEVRRLHAAGLSITKIAKQTGMAWSTARLIVDAGGGGTHEITKGPAAIARGRS